MDLSGGSFRNLGDISVSVGANSLVIVPAGFNPATLFGSYTNLGMTHVAGTTLNVPAQQGFAGTGTISDPVNCQGSITQSTEVPTTRAGTLNLDGGLTPSWYRQSPARRFGWKRQRDYERFFLSHYRRLSAKHESLCR